MGYKIRRVRLVNIRSHVDTVVEFSTGVNLIEGDVGSGKTTILQSVEAALFGYEIKNMLRIGENAGEVRVEFEPPLQVSWRITRQGARGGYIVADGVRAELAAGEIRSFFVKKFGLSDNPSVRSEPTMFRLAVYVRQEELKSILRGGTEVEELVRRATGVRVYSTARENAGLVLRPLLDGYIGRLDERIRLLEERLAQTEGVETQLRDAENALNVVVDQLKSIEDNYARISGEVEELRGRVNQLEASLARVSGELGGAQQEKIRLESQLNTLSNKILADEARVLELSGGVHGLDKLGGMDYRAIEERERGLLQKIRDLTRAKARFESDLEAIDRHKARANELRQRMGGVVLDYLWLKGERDALESRLKAYYQERAELEKTVSDYRRIAESGVCPLCGSRIAPDQYESHLGELEAKLRGIMEQIGSLEAKRRELNDLMEQARVQEALRRELEERETEINRISAGLVYEDYDEEINQASKELDAARTLKELLNVEDRLEGEKKQHSDLERQLEDVEARVQKLVTEREQLSSTLSGLRPQLDRKLVDMDRLDEERRRLIARRSSLESQVSSLRDTLDQRTRDSKELGDAKQKRKALSGLQEYVAKVFVPTLEQVERDKLLRASRELSAKTKEYFALLMQDDDRAIRLEDDYSPVLQRRINGVWLDIPSPSGGERSAMALSFRLALSEVARSKQGIQADFIMLDEPTDGFSEDQLAKFQSLIERLEIPQIILVTHHRSFESLGSSIVLVEYTPNGSVVRRVS